MPVSTMLTDAIAYASLVSMSLASTAIGSARSVDYIQREKQDGRKPEVVTTKDAAMFPVYASMALMGAYVVFRTLSKQYSNMLISIYFLLFGTISIVNVMRPVFRKLLPEKIPYLPNTKYLLTLRELPDSAHNDQSLLIATENSEDKKDVNAVDENTGSTNQQSEDKSIVEKIEFDAKDLILLALSTVFSVSHFMTKHWISSNVIAIAISIGAIEMIQLNQFQNGAIMFCGLFVYDVFWVFGTDVMVSVAKNFTGPIKITFPRNIFLPGALSGTDKTVRHAMLGLGDIVVPGIFMALLRRFDKHQADENAENPSPVPPTYYPLTMFMYFLSLVTTVLVMTVFNRAQPALLYIVPMCLIPVLVNAALHPNQIKKLLAYKDHEDLTTEETSEESSGGSSSDQEEEEEELAKKSN